MLQKKRKIIANKDTPLHNAHEQHTGFWFQNDPVFFPPSFFQLSKRFSDSTDLNHSFSFNELTLSARIDCKIGSSLSQITGNRSCVNKTFSKIRVNWFWQFSKGSCNIPSKLPLCVNAE